MRETGRREIKAGNRQGKECEGKVEMGGGMRRCMMARKPSTINRLLKCLVFESSGCDRQFCKSSQSRIIK